MKPIRLPGCRFASAACVLVLAGLSQAAAQFPPPPGQGQAPQQDSAFPPPPAASQVPAQDPAFPPPPTPGRTSAPSGGISISPGGGGSFSGGGGGFAAAPPGGGFAAPGPGGGFSGPPQQGPSPEQRVCLAFPQIREEVEKSGGAIKAASARKASREEVCTLFKAFTAREGKMLTFLETNQKLCGVPPNIIVQIKQSHAKTLEMRTNICSNAPVGNAAPTLSDALGGPIIADDSTAKQPGRGTFDTLTGNALQR